MAWERGGGQTQKTLGFTSGSPKPLRGSYGEPETKPELTQRLVLSHWLLHNLMLNMQNVMPNFLHLRFGEMYYTDNLSLNQINCKFCLGPKANYNFVII